MQSLLWAQLEVGYLPSERFLAQALTCNHVRPPHCSPGYASLPRPPSKLVSHQCTSIHHHRQKAE